ncbi:hypothetical protein BY458DRAFT_554033 [Sporodiniella umbellata]|nr:hypothetical protein BY458DRAFT_554033 [Sporodiniella umbellata]
MSYISTLNLLNADSPTPLNEEAFQEELALWANAQFSFDTAPGSAIVEDKQKENDLLETFKEIAQLVQPQPQPDYYPSATANVSSILPRLAPAGSQSMEIKKPVLIEKEQESISAEEDKRRRNTAASARFRMKKKLREQELDKRSKEMSTYVESLETKVGDLEKEVKWLRALVIEKDPKLLP